MRKSRFGTIWFSGRSFSCGKSPLPSIEDKFESWARSHISIPSEFLEGLELCKSNKAMARCKVSSATVFAAWGTCTSNKTWLTNSFLLQRPKSIAMFCIRCFYFSCMHHCVHMQMTSSSTLCTYMYTSRCGPVFLWGGASCQLFWKKVFQSQASGEWARNKFYPRKKQSCLVSRVHRRKEIGLAEHVA